MLARTHFAASDRKRSRVAFAGEASRKEAHLDACPVQVRMVSFMAFQGHSVCGCVGTLFAVLCVAAPVPALSARTAQRCKRSAIHAVFDSPARVLCQCGRSLSISLREGCCDACIQLDLFVTWRGRRRTDSRNANTLSRTPLPTHAIASS